MMVMNPPTSAFNGQQTGRRGGEHQFAACVNGLRRDAFIEPVPAHGACSGFPWNAHGHGGVMRSVDGGAINLLEYGVFKPHLGHGPWVDQPSALEGPANGCVLLHQQDIDTPLSENGGQASPNGTGSDDNDVVVHGLNPGDGPHEACASFLLCEAVTHLLGFVQVQDGGKRVPLLRNQVGKGSDLAFCDQRSSFLARQFAFRDFTSDLNLAT